MAGGVSERASPPASHEEIADIVLTEFSELSRIEEHAVAMRAGFEPEAGPGSVHHPDHGLVIHGAAHQPDLVEARAKGSIAGVEYVRSGYGAEVLLFQHVEPEAPATGAAVDFRVRHAYGCHG